MRKTYPLAIFAAAFTIVCALTVGLALGADENKPVIVMAGFGNTPFTFSTVSGGTFEIGALIRGGAGELVVEAFLDLPSDEGEIETIRFGRLQDRDGDGVYSLVIERLPALAVGPGAFTGIRLVATDSEGNRAVWPALDVPLASSPLEAIEAEPPVVNLATPGDTVQLRVMGRFEDRTRVDISDSITGTAYTSQEAEVATVSPDGLVTAVGEGIAIITVQNGTFSDIAAIRVGIERARLLSISVAGPSSFNLTAIGQTAQLAVTGDFSDGSARDITSASSGTTYESSDETVATVGPNGTVTAVGVGTAIITISNSDLSDIAAVLVRTSGQTASAEAARLVSISISGAPDIVLAEPGATRQLSVSGRFSDGSSGDLTAASAGTIYSSSDPSIVSVGSDGLLTAQGTGAATVAAANGDLTATASVSVSPSQPALVSLSITPSNLLFNGVGQTASLSVQGNYTDGASADLTEPSTGTVYSSSDENVASVDPSGTITAVNQGSATITAQNGDVSASISITVSF